MNFRLRSIGAKAGFATIGAVLVLASFAYATVEVYRSSGAILTLPDGGMFIGNNRHQRPAVRPSMTAGALLDDAKYQRATVYETSETYKRQEVDTKIKEQVDATEKRIQDEVISSLKSMPQRLLADEAQKALKDAVLAELRKDLTQTRQEVQELREQNANLQEQIDALKRNQPPVRPDTALRK